MQNQTLVGNQKGIKSTVNIVTQSVHGEEESDDEKPHSFGLRRRCWWSTLPVVSSAVVFEVGDASFPVSVMLGWLQKAERTSREATPDSDSFSVVSLYGFGVFDDGGSACSAYYSKRTRIWPAVEQEACVFGSMDQFHV